MDQFVGKWSLTQSSKFDEYLGELGINYIQRKLATNSKPVQDISVADGVTTIKTLSIRNTEIKFKIDEEFDELTTDGLQIKSIVTKESDTKFVHIQKRKLDNIITRELIGDEYVMTLQYNDVISVRKYKKTTT